MGESQNTNFEESLSIIESNANFMRGMIFDPRIDSDIKSALQVKIDEA